MKTTELKTKDRVLIPSCQIASSFFARFFGLMGKAGIPKTEAICFPRCNSIHTFFMRFPIDVIFVSATGEVVEILSPMNPWRMLWPRKNAKHAIEMAASLSGELGISKGMKLHCQGVWT